MAVRVLAIVALLLWCLQTAAQAQTVGGTYRVNGTNFDGSRYTGTAEITPNGSTCRIRWHTGNNAWGTCMLSRRAFAAHYRMGNEWGLIVYELQGDGSLAGVWTIEGRAGAGTEILTPLR